jgi:predicted ArsR family transcriptional regulator
MIARMLLRLAEATGAGAEEARDTGRDQGLADAPALARRGCLAAVEARMAELGFDPAVAAEDDVATVAFAHCPFRELAERRPDLICNLHRGLVEGLVAGVGGGAVEGFGTLVDRDPCRVDLRLDGEADDALADEPLPVAGR